MPRGDGTGPMGPGRGMGRGMGQGRGIGGRGRGMGPAGNCICPNCGEVVPHRRGMPCSQVQCPKCGTFMVRE